MAARPPAVQTARRGAPPDNPRHREAFVTALGLAAKIRQSASKAVPKTAASKRGPKPAKTAR